MPTDWGSWGLSLPIPSLDRHEFRFVLALSIVALAITSIPYLLGAALATEDRVFGGFVYATEDCYSYLAKMRQGAEGAWLFHIVYTPEPHPGALFFPFHLLLGKVAALLPGGDLVARMVCVYHGARLLFGFGLLLTVYRFLAVFTERVALRRLAWLLVTFGGGLGWLLVALEQPDWLGSEPLDFILPEGFTFLVLYAFPHIALGRTLLLWGILFLLRAWEERAKLEAQSSGHAVRHTQYTSRFTHHVSRMAYCVLAGLAWLLMGLIVPFYVAVAWAVTGAAWLVLSLRERRIAWREGLLAAVAMFIAAPVVAYSAWVFTSDKVYATWAAQNKILSPHPLHYLVAYGVPLVLAALAVRGAWRDERPLWLPLAWVGIVPVLVYVPFNLQRRLVEGVQVPLSLLAALGVLSSRLQGFRSRLVIAVLLTGLSLTNVLLVAGNCLVLQGLPAPIYRSVGEVAALDRLNERVEPDDVVLVAYETGNYLPARVRARAFVGHGPESVHADEKKALVARFFDAATEDAWRRQLLSQYGVDYVFWGPVEQDLGGFKPEKVGYLEPVYEAGGYVLFEVVE
jgi:hypothetical protein